MLLCSTIKGAISPQHIHNYLHVSIVVWLKMMLFVLLVLISSGAVNVMSGSGGSGLGLGSGEDPLENVTLTCAE